MRNAFERLDTIRMFAPFSPTNEYVVTSPLDRQTVLAELHRAVQSPTNARMAAGQRLCGSIRHDEFVVYCPAGEENKSRILGAQVQVMLHGRLYDHQDGSLIMVRESLARPRQNLYNLASAVLLIVCFLCVAATLYCLVTGHRAPRSIAWWTPSTNPIRVYGSYFAICAFLQQCCQWLLRASFKENADRTRLRILQEIHGQRVQVPVTRTNPAASVH